MLRYEHAEQDNLIQGSDALTHSIRLGLEAKFHPKLFALVEGEAVYSLANDFNDGTQIPATQPVIADPDTLELNRFQLQANLTEQTFLTLGRQRIRLDDQRFLGAAPFRQNSQSFDGLHASTRLPNGTTFQAGYFNRVNRPLGADNPLGRFRGDSYYFNVNFSTPIGRLGAFHYALDLETGPDFTPINTNSSRTSGVRLDGRWHADTIGVDWEASYARQADFANNPIDYEADYWLLGLQAFAGPARLGFRAETLGAGNGQSFQTPAGTLHKFQGDADIFLITPPDGVQDFAASANWQFGNLGWFTGIAASARHHWFQAERGGATYGTEIDLALSASVRSVQLSLIYANYDAESFAADTERIFLSVSRSF